MMPKNPKYVVGTAERHETDAEDDSAEYEIAEEVYSREGDVRSGERVRDDMGEAGLWTTLSLGFAGHVTSS